MRKDDDIAAFLPRSPPPAPARREATIAAALRRFDGEAPAAPVGPARPEPWRLRISRPYAGALAGAFLVALIALPLAWTSIPDHVREGGGERRAEPVAEMADSASPTADARPAEPATAPPAPSASEPQTAADPVAGAVPVAPAQMVLPSPAEAKASQRSPAAGERELADVVETRDSQITVTGSRVRRPNLESSVPITVVGQEEVAVSGSRSSRAARRGDWNACTIEDPRPGACRKPASGRASTDIADGLARAWAGDVDKAIAAFDRAIEIAPRSAPAYLNRALAYRRRGDLDRALADLDRAVRYSPEEARGYYYRSLVLRQRGDVRRAQADEARAADLDPRYAPLVR